MANKNSTFCDIISGVNPSENSLKSDPSCPMCGVPMEKYGVLTNSWFCCGERQRHREHIAKAEVRQRAYKTHMNMGIVFTTDIATKGKRAAHLRNWNHELQNAIIGVAEDDDEDVWVLVSVRGPQGSTNFSLSCYTRHNKPLALGLEWKLADWWGSDDE